MYLYIGDALLYIAHAMDYAGWIVAMALAALAAITVYGNLRFYNLSLRRLAEARSLYRLLVDARNLLQYVDMAGHHPKSHLLELVKTFLAELSKVEGFKK